MTGPAVGSSAVVLVPNPFSFSIPGHSWQTRSKGAAWSDGNEPVLHPCAFQTLSWPKGNWDVLCVLTGGDLAFSNGS